MKNGTDFLYLDERDTIAAGVLDYEKCTNVLEEIFTLIASGDYVMGGDTHNSHGIEMKFPKESPFPNMPTDAPDRRFMAMPAYVGGRFNVAGQKWYGSNIKNPEKGLPRSILTVMLNDPDTCEPLALMSANLISAVRTGCVPAVGVRHLAKKSSKTCACIGAGPVGRSCFEAIATEMKSIENLVVYDLFPEKAESFCKDMTERFGVCSRVANSLEEAVREGDIISVAASSLKPIKLDDEWLGPGSLLILSGRCTSDESYFSSAKIIFDNVKMHETYYGEHLILPEEERFVAGIGVAIYKMIYEKKLPPLYEATGLGDVISGKKIGRGSDEERICFIAGGMPVWDLGWGYEIYKTALELGIGKSLNLWQSPYQMKN